MKKTRNKVPSSLKKQGADASNIAIRSVLNRLSNAMRGPLYDDDMEKALAFFDGKCPYTDVDLSQDVKNGNKTYDIDHIIGQNKEECGLSWLGNVAYVTKKANQAKNRYVDFEDFLKNDTYCLGNINQQERQKRIEKIKQYQKAFNYDPQTIKSIVSPLLEEMYYRIKDDQNNGFKMIAKKLYNHNLLTRDKLKMFEKVLLDNNYTLNTAKSYKRAIANVLKENYIQIDELDKNINKYIKNYKENGKDCVKDHATTFNALKNYKKYCL